MRSHWIASPLGRPSCKTRTWLICGPPTRPSSRGPTSWASRWSTQVARTCSCYRSTSCGTRRMSWPPPGDSTSVSPRAAANTRGQHGLGSTLDALTHWHTLGRLHLRLHVRGLLYLLHWQMAALRSSPRVRLVPALARTPRRELPDRRRPRRPRSGRRAAEPRARQVLRAEADEPHLRLEQHAAEASALRSVSRLLRRQAYLRVTGRHYNLQGLVLHPRRCVHFAELLRRTKSSRKARGAGELDPPASLAPRTRSSHRTAY
mmetsp:Transcript_9735/g.24978  ORF Transcript_9735/g.24978 Transcript_9735/m.24978 type:complete len:261 (-) Transcript_9735:163-945(-)